MKEQIQQLLDTFIPNQRKKDFASFAAEHGFSFQSRAGIDFQDFGIRGFTILKSKYWNEFRGIVTKQFPAIQSSIRLYDYMGTNKMGNFTTTVIEINCEALNISKFHIHPIPKIKKLKTLFLDPENDFFDNYEIDSEHVETIIDELGSECLDYLNSFKKISMEGEGSYILLYHRHKKIKIYNLSHYVQHVTELMECILSDNTNYDFV